MGVWVWRRRLGRYVDLKHPNGMKLEDKQVRWIVREKQKGRLTNAQIAESMHVSIRWVQKLWARHKNHDIRGISHPNPMGRPENGMPGRREHSAVLSLRHRWHAGASTLQRLAAERIGTDIPKGIIHGMLREENLAARHPKKSRKRSYVRYERDHSNSLWHTDWKLLPDGRWFLCYLDDASRFITGYGVFENATTDNALSVLDGAMARHGKPAAVMTDHGPQFYANEKEATRRGESVFERRLVEMGIRQILAGIGHPQTNGKAERFHGEIQRKLHEFEDVAGPPGSGAPIGCETIEQDPVARLVRWYNYDRPHQSLDWDILETPAQAFIRKMPAPGQTVIDEETGEEYRVGQGG